jgi:hypothetical protein
VFIAALKQAAECLVRLVQDADGEGDALIGRIPD